VATRETSVGVAEEPACDDVEETEDRGQDAACNDDAPQREAKVHLVCCCLVEISQEVEAESDHGQAEIGKTVFDTQDWPGFDEVHLEPKPGNLGDDEEDGDGACDEVGEGVEEEEVGGLDGHHQHDPAGDRNQEEGDDVANAEDVEHQISRTRQLRLAVHVEHFA